MTRSGSHDPLRAVFVNGTLKPSPAVSHTEGLMNVSRAILEANGVQVDAVRAVDHAIAPGVYPDLRERGAVDDAWPALWPRIEAADILVLGTPIWLGEVGPGPSHLDPGSGGPQNDLTRRNATFMSHNLIHLARMLRDSGGIPAEGNVRTAWDAGERFDHPNPEYR